jgi:hypothetical protein
VLCTEILPDESQTGINVRVFLDPLAREVGKSSEVLGRREPLRLAIWLGEAAQQAAAKLSALSGECGFQPCFGSD